MVGTFLAGFCTNVVLFPLFSPVTEFAMHERDNLLCPNDLWCNTHQEFIASTDLQCGIGSLDSLVQQAIYDGDIDGGIHQGEFSKTKRTYLCADVSRGMQRSSIHLRNLASEYNSCFQYIERKGKKDDFLVKTGVKSSTCVSNVRINPTTGKFDIAEKYMQAHIFCFPAVQNSKRTLVASEDLPLCTRDVLAEIGIPQYLLQIGG